MKTSNFTFKGEENIDVYVYKWESKDSTNTKGIIQIAHGMSETASRYEEFAKELVKDGYTVYINDHRGHGNTANSIDKVGILSTSNGFEHLVKDMKNLTDIIKKENEDKPLILLGHSMGSFATQRYIIEYGDELSGVILSGSNGKQGKILEVATIIISLIIIVKGREHRSKFIDSLIFGGNNKKFNPTRTDFDWLSRDEKEVDKYIENPYCGVLFTSGFFYDLVSGLKTIESIERVKEIPKSLPMYIFSGDKDPVGKNGKGVMKLVNTYKKVGIENVSHRLYKDGRHEMLNEINKEEVMKDVISWLNTIV